MRGMNFALPLELPAAPEAPRSPQAAQTPMMAQYWALKNAHPDCLLFFRMGDFYELFFDDAVKAAPLLDVALTRRGKDAGEDVPMCGVPVHAYESYLPRLIRTGQKVAIAEQMEDPAEAKKRGGKAIVARDVVRIITPGTLTEEAFLERAKANYLAALAVQGEEVTLAWCDINEGQPFVQAAAPETLPALLARIAPSEIIFSEKLLEREDMQSVLAAYKDQLSPLPQSRFDSESAKRAALSQYAVTSLDGFGAFSRTGATALGALIDYLRLTQKQNVKLLARPKLLNADSVMAIDPATRRNLELTETLTGERKGSFLEAIDRTLTAGGARLLEEMLAAPLMDVAAIEARQNTTRFFVAEASLRGKLREALRSCPDMARALARLSLTRGTPRDLAQLRIGLETAQALHVLLAGAEALHEITKDLGEHSALTEKLKHALRDELPAFARDGGFIAPGFSPALDELIALRDDSKRLIMALQAKYAAATGITALKIRHNNIIGYHVDLTPSQADRLLSPPLNAQFIHRQTLASSVRFTTTELADLERRAGEAAGRALALELQLFGELCVDVLARLIPIKNAAAALAALDVHAGMAELAASENWVCPVVDASRAFAVEGGRHPVVEKALRAEGAQPFTPNSCDLSKAHLWLITGPNMAGKSTFLRQNALLAILAQMGSFVPAAKAHIGLVDKLFSRVGAADDLARGRSTFMVEMVETAAILNQATERSLVILDEIGRGTATYDGLSIAWGCLEYLYHHNRCRALFATHYHELTALTQTLPQMKSAHASVREWEGQIVFLHEIRDGAAQGSFGLHVARLAGLPEGVLKRAESILSGLEADGKTTVSVAPVTADAFKAPAPQRASALETALEALNPDNLSPKDALETLYTLKATAKKERR